MTVNVPAQTDVLVVGAGPAGSAAAAWAARLGFDVLVTDAACNPAKQAADIEDEVGARVAASQSRTLEGQSLAAAGRRDDAITVLQRAEAELAACGAVRFADGAFATIDPSWSRGEGYPTWGDVNLRISGTSGVLDVDPFAQSLRTFDHETGTPSWSYMGEDMNALMLADFLRGVAEGEPSGASGLDGLRTLEVVLAAYRSGEDHEPKKIERRT